MSPTTSLTNIVNVTKAKVDQPTTTKPTNCWYPDAVCYSCARGLNPTPTNPNYVWALYRQNPKQTPAIFACGDHDTTGLSQGVVNVQGGIIMRTVPYVSKRPPRVKRPVPVQLRPYIEKRQEMKRERERIAELLRDEEKRQTSLLFLTEKNERG